MPYKVAKQDLTGTHSCPSHSPLSLSLQAHHQPIPHTHLLPGDHRKFDGHWCRVSGAARVVVRLA